MIIARRRFDLAELSGNPRYVGRPNRSTRRTRVGRVGSTGSVLTSDLDIDLLKRIDAPNVAVRRIDVTRDDLGSGYDLVVARAILHHLPERVGPIPLSRARELCGGADGWMRILTHPETGVVLSVGRDQYRPPPALRKLVRWRADRCMAPGCGIPASRCEVDHTIAWEQGGRTSLDNLAPLCKGHHTVKHHGGWRVRQVQDGDGALEWISPAGRRYVVQPERRVPVFRPSEQGDAPF